MRAPDFSGMAKRGLRLAVLLPLMLAAACATVAPRHSSGPPPAYRDTITLAGQIAVHYQQNGEPQHASGSYTWVQKEQTTDVTLLSPLGQTLAVLKVTPQAATLTQAGQPARTAPDIDTLTTQMLGWPLPVSGLRQWLQGRAIDAGGKSYVAAPERDTVTTQDGWRLRYVWSDDDSEPNFQRIELERAVAAQAADVTMRITIVESH